MQRYCRDLRAITSKSRVTPAFLDPFSEPGLISDQLLIETRLYRTLLRVSAAGFAVSMRSTPLNFRLGSMKFVIIHCIYIP